MTLQHERVFGLLPGHRWGVARPRAVAGDNPFQMTRAGSSFMGVLNPAFPTQRCLNRDWSWSGLFSCNGLIPAARPSLVR